MLYISIMKRSNFFENPQIAPTITPTVMLIAAHTNAREIEILDPYQIASNVDCPDAPVPSIQWMPAPSCDIAWLKCFVVESSMLPYLSKSTNNG